MNDGARGRKALTDLLAEGFVARTLAKAEWTHIAHLRVGLWHLLRQPPDEVLAMLRTRIRALNESHGVANSGTSGYHETITRFYVWRIATFLDATDRERPVDDLADELVRLHGDKDLPLRYWSREKLFSPEARGGWVEPDLLALAVDGSGASRGAGGGD